MISKFKVRRRNINLGHVARRAIFLRHRTTGPIACFRRLTLQCMTLQTSLIVISGIFPERLVWVMTCLTAYVAFIRITLAVKDMIVLKTDVVGPQALQQRELFGTTMTRSTELLRQLITTQQA